MSQFKDNQPIIIGLAGRAGSGKTSVAEHIVPKGSVELTKHGIKWDHIFYALPLYELASIRKSIKGFNEDNRQLYAIHDVLFDIYGGSALGLVPSYSDLVSRVHEIKNLPMEPEGVKPRSFLQKAGDVCRKDFEDCFAKWGINKSGSLYRDYLKSLGEEEELMQFVVIISDVRFENEAKAILDQPNGVVVCFDASDETLNERLIKRDGKGMDPDLASHKSEHGIEAIKNMTKYIINTDNMSIEDQASATIDILKIAQMSNA
jgi:cytidylate kinase